MEYYRSITAFSRMQQQTQASKQASKQAGSILQCWHQLWRRSSTNGCGRHRKRKRKQREGIWQQRKGKYNTGQYIQRKQRVRRIQQRQKENIQHYNTQQPFNKGKAKGKAKGKQVPVPHMEDATAASYDPTAAWYEQQHTYDAQWWNSDIQSQQQLALPAPTPIQAVTTMPPAPTQTTPPQQAKYGTA